MSETPKQTGAGDKSGFGGAAERGNPGLLRELWDLVRTSRKWWLVPILIVLLVLGVLVVLGTTAAAPFIYQLF